MKLKLLTALTLGLFAFTATHAEVQVNGFASIVTGIDLNDESPITSTTSDQAYTDRQADQLQESRVGLQITAPLEDNLRFIGQLVAKGEADGGYAPTYDWAYFDMNVGSSDKLKIGRVRIPFYKYSDYLDVGYAYHWITPPKSMYSLSFSNADGVSYLHNGNYAGIDMSLNVLYGRYQGVLTLGGNPVNGNLENLITLNWSATFGNHEVYAAYAQADVYIDAGSLIVTTGGDTYDEIITAADPNYSLNDGDTGSFVGFGYKGTFGDVGLFAEYSIVEVADSALTDTSGGYIGVSYAMGDYVYHVTYEIEEDKEKSINNALADSIMQRLGNRGSAGDATSITIGARRDIGSSSAIKVEVTQYDESRYTATSGTSKDDRGFTQLRIALETMF